jgi:hypothetical protein
MGTEYRKRHTLRAAYLEKVRQRRTIVAGQIDYDFSQHLAPLARDTYAGQAKAEGWRKECLDDDFYARLVREVKMLAARAEWEKEYERRWRRKNGMPPTLDEIEETDADG